QRHVLGDVVAQHGVLATQAGGDEVAVLLRGLEAGAGQLGPVAGGVEFVLLGDELGTHVRPAGLHAGVDVGRLGGPGGCDYCLGHDTGGGQDGDGGEGDEDGAECDRSDLAAQQPVDAVDEGVVGPVHGAHLG